MARTKGPARAENGPRPKKGPARPRSPQRLQHPLPNPPHWNTRRSPPPPPPPRRQHGDARQRERSPFRFQMNTQPSIRSRDSRQGPTRNGPRYADGDRTEFTFRSQHPAPRFPPQERRDPDSYRPAPRRDRPDERNYRRYPSKNGTHNRPIMRALNDREKTPERLAGMTDAPSRFRAVQDLSNSDDDEVDEDDPNKLPTKRRKVDASNAIVVATKWSNPDPYTTLPPVDENRAKRTDVVQLIRKAKVKAAEAASSNNAIAENSDYVPLDFGSDGSDDEDDVDHRNDYPFNANSGIPFDVRPSQPEPRTASGSKRKRPGFLPGNVIDEWAPVSTSGLTPWLTEDHSATEHMGFWLHKEICDFYNFVKPTESEERVRQSLFKRVYDVLRNYRSGSLYCFGSFAAGLYLPNGDMDLVFVSRAFEEQGRPVYATRNMLHACLEKLRDAGIVRDRTGIAITKAKVPIIKFVDDVTGIKVDISFENLTGVVANDTYEKWKREHPAMVYLIPVIKQFLMMRDLNEVFSGGLGGFSITCMVVSFLQHHPAIQSGNMIAERHLGELLVEFLDLYGNKFNMETTGITLNPPGYFPKVFEIKGKMPNRNKWTIIDPNNNENDISGGTSKAREIAKKFRDACNAIKDRMQQLEQLDIAARKGQSILGRLIGGNYATFSKQRARLNDVFVDSVDGAREQ